MAQLKSDFIEAAGREREVTLTTFGRKSGKEHRVTIWIVTDGSRVYIRSGQGFRRHWPQNLMARQQGGLRLGTRTIKVEVGGGGVAGFHEFEISEPAALELFNKLKVKLQERGQL